MSDDTIKRSDAIDAVIKAEIRASIYYKPNWDMVKKFIANIPSADRPQGEWIVEMDDAGNTYGRCPICGMKQYAGQLNFCPDCGAKMKGVDENPLAGIEPKPIPTKKHTFVYRKGADDE